MLPSFPELERFKSEENLNYIRTRMRELSAFLAVIQGHIQFEGHGGQLQQPDGKIQHIEMKSASGKTFVSRGPLTEVSPTFLNEKREEVADGLAREISQSIQETLEKVTEETGNVVDGRGREITEDLLLETLDTMDHSFDRFGIWQPPVVVCGPQIFAQIQKLHETPSGRKKLEMLLVRKRDEFFSREASRVLVG